MIVPSIDIQGGQTVQLRQGAVKMLDAGDPRPIAQRFGVVGEIAVIDLDAAMGTGSNEALIRELLPLARCRVGGGIRDAATARKWLDAGASKVILGTAAKPEILSELPRERVIAALDARDGEVVVEGWKTKTGRGVLERIAELRSLVGGFLVTFVEIEGTLSGLNASRVKPIVEAAKGCRVTAAGGITTPAEVAALDAIGADSQVGMAIYTGKMSVADAFAAPLVSDRPDGLWPTVVCDERGTALGLVYSNAQSVRAAIDERRGVYWSRSRGRLWRKGEESGATQTLLRADVDCDRDALRFTVTQDGPGFCHEGTRTCFGEDRGLGALSRRLATTARDGASDPGSYTARLLRDSALLAAKIEEEAGELNAAVSRSEVVHEAADVLFFTLTRLAKEGISLAEIDAELDRRALMVSRRPGNAKPNRAGGAS